LAPRFPKGTNRTHKIIFLKKINMGVKKNAEYYAEHKAVLKTTKITKKRVQTIKLKQCMSKSQKRHF